jgi:hypothetical protein
MNGIRYSGHSLAVNASFIQSTRRRGCSDGGAGGGERRWGIAIGRGISRTGGCGTAVAGGLVSGEDVSAEDGEPAGGGSGVGLEPLGLPSAICTTDFGVPAL